MKTHEKYLTESNPVEKALKKQKKSNPVEKPLKKQKKLNTGAVGKNRTSFSLLSTAVMEQATRMGEKLWIVTSDQDSHLMEIYDKGIAMAVAKAFKIKVM